MRLTRAGDLDVANHLADIADGITMGHFASPELHIAYKGDGSPVCEADREVEQAIRKALGLVRPNDSIVGEEQGGPIFSRRRWVVDPIDGTRAFLARLRTFAALIALEEDGEVVLGLASAPGLSRRWWATKGAGAHRNGRPIQVSRTSDLQRTVATLVGVPAPRAGYALPGHQDGLPKLLAGGFHMHLLVAEGKHDVAVDARASLWDLAAIKVIVEEAGGLFTDIRGRPTPGGGSGVSTNGLVHAQLLDYLGACSPSPSG